MIAGCGIEIANTSDDPRAREVLTRMAHVLEETDLRNLGVNIIWVDSFDEIPGILEDVARPLPNTV